MWRQDPLSFSLPTRQFFCFMSAGIMNAEGVVQFDVFYNSIFRV